MDVLAHVCLQKFPWVYGGSCAPAGDRILVLIVKHESGCGSRWRHSPGIKGREGKGDHLQDWIPISLWSNCSCFSGFCRFWLVPHFQFYLISLNPRRLTTSCCAFVFIHFLIPVCIFSSPSHSLCDTEFISCHLIWLQYHFHVWNTIRGHVTHWPYTTRFLHQSDFIDWMSVWVIRPCGYVPYTPSF